MSVIWSVFHSNLFFLEAFSHLFLTSNVMEIFAIANSNYLQPLQFSLHIVQILVDVDFRLSHCTRMFFIQSVTLKLVGRQVKLYILAMT
jgi:hypothetical protein